MALYDYLYVDLPRVISLYSQLTGGIVESRETVREYSKSADNKRAYDFKVFRHDAGGVANDKSASKELVKPHHSVLVELEDELRKQGFLLDLDVEDCNLSLRDPRVRELLGATLCVKVTGRAVIEDYERMKGIARAFPEITKFINKSIESGIKQSPGYLEVQKQLEDLSLGLKDEKDRNKRTSIEAKVKKLKSELAQVVSSVSSVSPIEPWILEGFHSWVDAFLPDIINLRVYPYLERPDEQIFGHLKREYFEDADTSSFHFTYGSKPTERISLIGIVTAIPTETPDSFDPLAEFVGDGLKDSEAVESGFRGLFRGFDGLEQMIRTSRFPRVLVQPIVVYRNVEPNKSMRDAQQTPSV